MTERRRAIASGAVLSLALMSGGDIVAPQTANASEGRSVTVSSTGKDTNTGIKLKAGDAVSIDAVGWWTMDHRSLPYTGPGGYPPNIDANVWNGNRACTVDPDLPYGTLIAKIGDDITPVGYGATIIASEDGRLTLFPNDKKNNEMDCRSDNDGGSTADIIVFRK